MAFPKKKIYGQSKQETCEFCGKTALLKNSQGLTVCSEHSKSVLEGKKCACGEMMQVKESKWGAFFLCKNCGPISTKKANENLDNSEYNINKKYRKQPVEAKPKTDENKIMTLDELEEYFSKED